ncbi:hypothetical protein CRG98_021441 [Punica granatum]|uniref:Uncharacterized protein n=1 Tax=Punica granatum TaxID=22663 RepID=A0A2I0JQH0_PUNGR|nr:hypothetical protein CRG98_021441 [Punica granatum]
MGVGRLGWPLRAVGARKTTSVAAGEDRARHSSSDHGTNVRLVRNHWLVVLDRRPLAGGDLGIRDRGFSQCFLNARFWVPFTCPHIERPGSPVRKAFVYVWECPGFTQDASEVCPDVPLVILAPREIFRVPYWIPSDTPLIR